MLLHTIQLSAILPKVAMLSKYVTCYLLTVVLLSIILLPVILINVFSVQNATLLIVILLYIILVNGVQSIILIHVALMSVILL
jgi:hypothetical protein